MPEPITLRLLDLYRIGPGPSSSHTLGPMRAAAKFRTGCLQRGILPARLEVDLLGSLSATGRGHGTDRAVLAGLCGWEPETVDPDDFLALRDRLKQDPAVGWGTGTVRIDAGVIRFISLKDVRVADLPHPNTMRLRALHEDGGIALEEIWCSVGGGFVHRAGDEARALSAEPPAPPVHPFHDAASLLEISKRVGGGFGDVVLANERAWEASTGALAKGLDRVWQGFQDSAARGLGRSGELPGGLGLRRRAQSLRQRVDTGAVDPEYAPIATAQAFAYAINEENAAGGRVVTAPTNGAAGILPGVLLEVAERVSLTRDQIHRALATAGAVAMIIKTHASISGAEVGCQGEVGSATAMAAAALCEILGGDVEQVEYAAEMGIEHNLGLTCDPLKGLVQAPCIERNAMGVAKAWSAAQLALHSDGYHVISLDRVIRVMKRTGDDMRGEYKETAEGGLAVSLPEC